MKKILLIIIVLFAALPVQGAFAAQYYTYKFASPLDVDQLEIYGTGRYIAISTISSPDDSTMVVSNAGALPSQFAFSRRIYGLSITFEENPVPNVTKVVFKKNGITLSPEIISEPTPTPTPTPHVTGLLIRKAVSHSNTVNAANGNDGNLDTFMTMKSNGFTEYVLGGDATINSIFLKASDYWNLAIQLSDRSGAIIKTVSSETGGEWKSISPINNVYRVKLYSSSAANIDVYEVDINGTFATPTPTPTNTDSSLFVINGLDKVVDSSTSLTLNWSPINSVYLKHYKVYQDNVLIGTVNTNFLSVSGLTAGQTYEFKVTPVDTFDMEFAPGTLSYTVPIPDTTPPGIPKNIKVVPDRYNAAVSWAGPSDPDLLGYYIYLDDMRVNPSPIQTASHNLTGLKPDTDYQIRVAAVDTSGNISEQSPAVTFKTLALQAAPLPPQNFSALPFYQGANLSWLPSTSAEQYIVYLDDKELFRTDKTNAKVSNLSNGQEYDFAVSAINGVGESDKSPVVTVKPTKQSMVDVSLGYNLQDLSDGTASMFGANWTLLAFAISIPLSFIIALYVKQVFSS